MKIHLIAIGGTGMGAVAGLLAEAGHEVRGSDQAIYPPMSTLLAELEIPVFEGYGAQNLDWAPERVVVGNTCKQDHVELRAARERGLEIVSFPQILREIFLAERQPLVVAGTHGKTTTTSLAAHLLAHAGQNPGYLIGGIPVGFGRSFAVGSPPHFVVEGDEYDSACFDKRPKFLHYGARTLILTGVEFDHADIYANLQEVEAAFAALIEQLPADARLLVYAGSPVAVRLCERARCPVTRYAAAKQGEQAPRADWLGLYVPLARGRQRLTIERDGAPLIGPVEVPMTGAHNMQNCVAVAAASAALGLAPETIAAGLASFAGVKRRQEVRGVVGGVTVIDDFAHHPTAITETLRGLRGVHGDGRLIAAFEPRSNSCRRNVFQHELARSLGEADLAFVAPLFAPEKIPPQERLDLERLRDEVAGGGTECTLPTDIDAMVGALAKTCRSGDTVVVMSSGGFDGLIPRLLDALPG